MAGDTQRDETVRQVAAAVNLGDREIIKVLVGVVQGLEERVAALEAREHETILYGY